MTEYPNVDRARMIQWAYGVELTGNRPGVDASRRCLLYLVSVCNLGSIENMRAWRQTREIADYAGLQERTAQRALKRLIDAGYVVRMACGQYTCFSIQYPGQAP
ncbi:MAG: hypothetical protein F4103_11905 [Boseongicola sp. SB0673_bin_14]|nr:hypothetical protein [Boseongicola sp. SB0673_bin_14]